MVKWIKDGLKKVGKFAKKGLSFVENVANKADKFSGGMLRSSLNVASGGLLDEGLKFYKNTRGARNMLLDAAEGKKLNKKDLVSNVKNAYGGLSSDTRNKIYSESKNINDKLNKQLTNLDINDNIKNALIKNKNESIDNKIFKR